MKSNTSYAVLALAAAAKMANAHTTVFAAWVNDVDQGLGNSASGYIRSPPNNNPVKDVTSTDMTCNVNGDTAAAKTISVKAGDKLTFEWHHNGRTDDDDIIASSHKGPILVYMAPTEKGAAGNGWVKIAEEGYTDGTWAVDTLITNKGKHSVTVPDVPAGKYMFRPEIIALHEGSTVGGAQLYMECVQVEVTSDGTNTLPEGVSIPGAYTAQDDGILFNIYGSFDSYPIPGPTVWDGASSAASTGSAKVAVAASSSAAAETPAATSAAAAAETPAAVETSAAAPAATSPATSAAAAPVEATTAAASPAASATPATGSSSGTVVEYAQCGGAGYKGATECASGLTCKEWNDFYSQCLSSA